MYENILLNFFNLIFSKQKIQMNAQEENHQPPSIHPKCKNLQEVICRQQNRQEAPTQHKAILQNATNVFHHITVMEKLIEQSKVLSIWPNISLVRMALLVTVAHVQENQSTLKSVVVVWCLTLVSNLYITIQKYLYESRNYPGKKNLY